MMPCAAANTSACASARRARLAAEPRGAEREYSRAAACRWPRHCGALAKAGPTSSVRENVLRRRTILQAGVGGKTAAVAQKVSALRYKAARGMLTAATRTTSFSRGPESMPLGLQR